MASLRPESAAALTAHRREAIRLAKAQEKAVSDKCIRAGQEVPAYTFDELIGKGSFGRVYRGRQNSTAKIVAIKVLDIDDADFQAFGDQKDEQIRDFNREIQILRQAQESGAENLNQMIEALPVHSQLWLICEYCPGGSVKTLMRATRDRLSENYLVVVARELGKALKCLHQAGIMHRDVKAANVLIHERGGLQLCDFGVAATLEGSKDKRRTFIGTLHWMPPELWNDKPEYSDEVDVWGYGCTLYECALGIPPNADLRERQQLKMRMRRLKQPLSLPDKESFSEGLRSLVKFALDPDAASRPSMQDILQHEYLTGTEQSHPTSSLTELVQHYYAWLFSGGQRVSLFMPGGAAAAAAAVEDSSFNIDDEWNFSMTQDFEKRVSAILEIPDLSDLEFNDDFEDQATPRQPRLVEHQEPEEMTATQKANFERRVQRGEGLANLFDQAKPAYEYKTKNDFVPLQPERRISDLPFRAMAEERPSSIASNVIDLGDFDSDDYAIVAPKSTDQHIQTAYAEPAMKEQSPFQLADAATIRAKRADSKGPRDPSGRSDRESFEQEEEDSYSGIAAQDFAMAQEDWTVRDGKPGLQEAAEITPTATRGTGRNTMEWSFASAMVELGNEDSWGSMESTPPSSNVSPEVTFNQTKESKAKKHATIEWSFSDAMAEIANSEPEDMAGHHTSTPKRPAPLLRTMTQPVTQSEIQDVYDDSVPSRPDTALSFAFSESSHTSTDIDPFALERHGEPDDYVHAGLDDSINGGSFYSHSASSSIGMSMNGPGPEDGPGPEEGPEDDSPPEDSITIPDDISTSDTPETHIDDRTLKPAIGMRLPQTFHIDPPQPPSMRRKPRNASGSVSSRGSLTSSNFNPKTTYTAAGELNHHRNKSSASSIGPRMGGSGTIYFPNPKPPVTAALAFDAKPELVARELDRLLEHFNSALGIAGDMLQEELRGRGRIRRENKTTNINGFGPLIGGSGSEWEDDMETIGINGSSIERDSNGNSISINDIEKERDRDKDEPQSFETPDRSSAPKEKDREVTNGLGIAGGISDVQSTEIPHEEAMRTSFSVDEKGTTRNSGTVSDTTSLTTATTTTTDQDVGAPAKENGGDSSPL